MESLDSYIFLHPYREYILGFPGVVSALHFEKDSIRIDKKIWFTIDEENERICLKLSLEDQQIFSKLGGTNIYPVPNKWGLQGYTFVHIKGLPEEMVHDMLVLSFKIIAPKKQLAAFYQNQQNEP